MYVCMYVYIYIYIYIHILTIRIAGSSRTAEALGRAPAAPNGLLLWLLIYLCIISVGYLLITYVCTISIIIIISSRICCLFIYDYYYFVVYCLFIIIISRISYLLVDY